MEVQRAILYYIIILCYVMLYNTMFIVPQLKSVWPCGFQASEIWGFYKGNTAYLLHVAYQVSQGWRHSL